MTGQRVVAVVVEKKEEEVMASWWSSVRSTKQSVHSVGPHQGRCSSVLWEPQGPVTSLQCRNQYPSFGRMVLSPRSLSTVCAAAYRYVWIHSGVAEYVEGNALTLRMSTMK
jgi:hypothetical protein